MLINLLKNKSVAVAVSGGTDSVTLLDMLAKKAEEFNITLSVINVEHGLRKESKADSLFVKNLAESYGIPFYGFAVDAKKYAKEQKLSEETAARILRYQIFDSFDKCDCIALAHHASDQAESILMHILRGSGAKGAVGMKALSGKYARPLLDTSKQEIERYIKENNLKFVTDSTNFENDKTRNFLRNVVFPELLKINERAVENVCRFGRNIAQDQDTLDSLADGKVILGDGFAKITDGTNCGLAVFARCVFKAAAHLGVNVDIESKHISDVFNLAQNSESGSSLDLPYRLKVYKDYDGLTFITGEVKQVSGAEVPLDGTSKEFDGKFVELSNVLDDGGLYFDFDKLPTGCVIRHRRRGDFFCKFGGGTKKLKDFLIDKKIPSRDRDALIVVAKESEVFIVCGVEISDEIKVDKNSKNIYSIVCK